MRDIKYRGAARKPWRAPLEKGESDTAKAPYVKANSGIGETRANIAHLGNVRSSSANGTPGEAAKETTPRQLFAFRHQRRETAQKVLGKKQYKGRLANGAQISPRKRSADFADSLANGARILPSRAIREITNWIWGGLGREWNWH